MARWNLKTTANASNISLQEFIEFETQLTVFIDGRNLQMQYEVISVFESHCVLFLMIAMHWRVVVGLKSCRYTLTRDPAVVWEGRRERESCRLYGSERELADHTTERLATPLCPGLRVRCCVLCVWKPGKDQRIWESLNRMNESKSENLELPGLPGITPKKLTKF